jgi:pantoate--beta-alanine ligase
MYEARNRRELRKFTAGWKHKGQSIALVPTMGNLHAGHLALVARARELADKVVSSIFVNPTQFEAQEDLANYPTTPDSDRKALQNAGCDLVFSPAADTIYPNGSEPGLMLTAPLGLASLLEGKFRPGHFDGVVTVVSRLFNLVTPDVAIFGEKDYQQFLIIQRMTEELGYNIRIHAVPTVREENGLAMSSRNSHLDSRQYTAAQHLFAVLNDTSLLAKKPSADFAELEMQAIKLLKNHNLRTDYLTIRRAQDLAVPEHGDSPLRILAAVWCGKTRLIDNLNLHLQ